MLRVFKTVFRQKLESKLSGNQHARTNRADLAGFGDPARATQPLISPQVFASAHSQTTKNTKLARIFTA
jgi:hypothetical protein